MNKGKTFTIAKLLQMVQQLEQTNQTAHIAMARHRLAMANAGASGDQVSASQQEANALSQAWRSSDNTENIMQYTSDFSVSPDLGTQSV